LKIFRENHKNDNQDELLDFYEFTLYMIFEICHEKWREWRKSYLGWIRKNPEILPSYHSYDFFLENDNLGLDGVHFRCGQKNCRPAAGPIRCRFWVFYSS